MRTDCSDFGLIRMRNAFNFDEPFGAAVELPATYKRRVNTCRRCRSQSTNAQLLRQILRSPCSPLMDRPGRRSGMRFIAMVVASAGYAAERRIRPVVCRRAWFSHAIVFSAESGKMTDTLDSQLSSHPALILIFILSSPLNEY